MIWIGVEQSEQMVKAVENTGGKIHIRKALEQDILPNRWKMGLIIPLHKKEVKTN